MVVGAHSADFVWRAGGAIAVATSQGGAARVLALSYGERGESGELWQEPDQTVERVKEIHPLFRGDCELVLSTGARVRLSRTRRAEFEKMFAAPVEG